MTRSDRLAAVFTSIAAHLGLLLVMFPLRPPPPAPVEPEAVSVSMFPAPEPPAPEPAPPSPAPAEPEPAPAPPAPDPPKPPPPQALARPTPVPPKIKPIAAAPKPQPTPAPPAPDPALRLSGGQLAGARTAGSGGAGTGGGGGGCDMVAFLERKLRRDPRVQAVVARAHGEAGGGSGEAYLVWNGDWIQSSGQDGKGLAGVREALMVEIAFAPEACRNDPVSGLVLLALDDRPDAVRLALRSGRWRWTDLVSKARR